MRKFLIGVAVSFVPLAVVAYIAAYALLPAESPDTPSTASTSVSADATPSPRWPHVLLSLCAAVLFAVPVVALTYPLAKYAAGETKRLRTPAAPPEP